jgi:DNA-binding transcriptional ArsR family regulator
LTFSLREDNINHVVEQLTRDYNLDRIFHALADPTRREILRLVAAGPRSVTDLARPFDMSLAAVSKHIQVLGSARLVTREKKGRVLTAKLNGEAMKTATEWLAYYRQFWEERLDSLEWMLSAEGDDDEKGKLDS